MSGILQTLIAGGQRTTWNPSDKAASISLSNGNLTATKASGATDALVRATVGKTSGKWHFEITVGTTGNTDRPGVGIANSTQSLTAYLGSSANSICLFASGDVYGSASIISAGATAPWGAGDVVAVEVDVGAQLIYFQVSGGLRTSGISFSFISGILFPALDLFDTGDVSTANFGGSAFTITPTSGYVAWNG